MWFASINSHYIKNENILKYIYINSFKNNDKTIIGEISYIVL